MLRPAASVLALLAATIMLSVTAQEDPPDLRLDDLSVTARKRQELLQNVPQSVTTLDEAFLRRNGTADLTEASRYVPNLFIGGFAPRHTRFPFIRGMAAGQGDPVATVYVDGVPQLTFSTVDSELLDIERIEVLRGPQGTLFGRNTLGGAIQLVTRKPDHILRLDAGTEFGSDDLQRYRLRLAGPLGEKVAGSLAATWFSRDGFTENEVTGHRLDHRESAAARAQLLITPAPDIEILFSLFHERDRDGDFVLADLDSLRDDPHNIRRDYDGFAHRDITSPALTLSVYGDTIDFVSITAFETWRTDASTDLDFTAADMQRRHTSEDQKMVFQEFRLQSPAESPLPLGEAVNLAWTVGVAAFYSDFTHESQNEFRPGAPPFFPPAPLFSTAEYHLRDYGVAPFAQGTLTFFDDLDLLLGLRYEQERKQADVDLDFPFLGTARQELTENYEQLLPRIGLAYRCSPTVQTYVSAAKGYRAGGYNRNTLPVGDYTYDEETSWTYETGVKTLWLDDRLAINLALFYIDWNDLQLDVPNSAIPGTYYLDNVGDARSHGFELESRWRLTQEWDLLAGIGYANAEFTDYVDPTSGRRVDGNELPWAPSYTWNAGLQYTGTVAEHYAWYGRGDLVGFGPIAYDSANTEGEGATVLVNLSAGVTRGRWTVAAWVRNLTDEEYIPLAIPAASTPSGWAGRAGDPRTFGLSLSVAL